MKIANKKHPSMAKSSAFKAKLRDEFNPEEHMTKLTEEQVAVAKDKLGTASRPSFIGHDPEKQAEHRDKAERDMRERSKKMAMGGEPESAPKGGVDYEVPDAGWGKIIVMRPKNAEGGEVEEDHKDSIAAAIMAKKERQMQLDSDSDEDTQYMMANGGIAERETPNHPDDAHLQTGEVDIDDNEREIPNQYYHRNEDSALKENYDESFMDMSQPEDSNEHGDSIDSDEHDHIDEMRRRMTARRQFKSE